jgi:hypothetical protein
MRLLEQTLTFFQAGFERQPSLTCGRPIGKGSPGVLVSRSGIATRSFEEAFECLIQANPQTQRTDLELPAKAEARY